MKLLPSLLLCAVLLLCGYTSNAQRDTEFWFAAPEVSEINDPTYGRYDRPILLRMTASENTATVTIAMPANTAFTPISVTVPANTSTTVDLTAWINQIENVTPNVVANKGLLITSTEDIFIYYEVMAQSCNCNPELFSLKGKNALGTNFIVSAQKTWAVDTIRFPNARTGFDIVATENNTQVTITPSKPMLGGRLAGQPFTISLNKGQSFSNQALYRNGLNMLDGSTITATKLIAVTAKEDLLFSDGPCADLAGDQLIPVNIWGHEFVIGRGDLFVRDKVVVTASEDGTEVFRDGNAAPVITLNKAQSYEFDLRSEVSTYIRTTKKSAVMHYTGVNCEVSSAVIPKLECTGSTKVSVFRSVNEYALLFIVTKNGNQGAFTFNGVAGVITAGDFTPVPGTGGAYVYAKKNMNSSMPVGVASRIENSSGKFQLGFLNGATPALTTGCRYGYFSDFKAGNVQKSQLQVCKGDSVQLSAVGGVSYEWSPATGLSHTNIANPKASPDDTTEYRVLITTAEGCVDSAFVKINVVTTSADFVSIPDVCQPLSMNFRPTSSLVTDPEWIFGAGNTPVLTMSPSYTFPATGTYDVTFRGRTEGCRDTVTKSIRVDLTDVNTLATTQDTTICAGVPTTIRATGALSYCWTPATSLTGTQTANPVTNTTSNITYYVTALVPGNNLLVNGDFSQGNTGFTSDYSLTATDGGQDQYNITNNPGAWSTGVTCTDHSSGTGQMMIVNGGTLPKAIWKQTVTVTPETNYVFGTWLQSTRSLNPAQLQLWINGKPVHDFTASAAVCQWQQHFITWNSGELTTLELAIVNNNTNAGGNDFAIDDLLFAPYQLQRDSVVVLTETPQVAATVPAPLCAGQQTTLQASGAQTYVWTPATALDNPASATPVANPLATTTYTVTGTTARGCRATDQVTLVVNPRPVVTISDDLSICPGTSTQLEAGGGIQYQWTPSSTLSTSSGPQPVATPAATTRYVVEVTDQNGCSEKDSVLVTVRTRPVFTVSANQIICAKDTVQLLATGGDIYDWLPATNLSSVTIGNPRAYPEQTTNYIVRITETTCQYQETLSTTVTVNPLPRVRASKSNDLDCSTISSQLSASGGISYVWTPATGLNNPRIAQPFATPGGAMQYVVKGTDINGCSDTASVQLAFAPINPSLSLMPTAFTPNRDGLNDCYGLNYWGMLQKVDFSVYNRWGQRVFHTNQPTGCWDGKFNGTDQPGGVYVYQVRAQTACGMVDRKGTFVLIR